STVVEDESAIGVPASVNLSAGQAPETLATVPARRTVIETGGGVGDAGSAACDEEMTSTLRPPHATAGTIRARQSHDGLMRVSVAGGLLLKATAMPRLSQRNSGSLFLSHLDEDAVALPR